MRLATSQMWWLLSFVVCACGSNSANGTMDAGVDTGVDTGISVLDLGGDLSLASDFGVPDLGSGIDAAIGCAMSCGAGQTCCVQGLVGVCESLAPGEACPLPDLTVLPEVVASTLSIQWEYIPEGDCSIVEGCTPSSGWRRLMRFTTQTPNIGTADARIGMPSADDPRFEYSACASHMHFHFLGYADYQLNDMAGSEVGHGHKQAFCLLDSERYIDSPTTPAEMRYLCSDQGIQRGWSDSYDSNLDCQWVDVTDVEPGDYTLRVRINHLRLLNESRYDNNEANVPVTVPADPFPAPLVPCEDGEEGPSRDCGWQIAAHESCEPYDEIEVACGSACSLGSCTGDAVMRVCEGESECGALQALASDDDTCGTRCPLVNFHCPRSGRYTVLSAPYDSSETYTCEVMKRVVPPPM